MNKSIYLTKAFGNTWHSYGVKGVIMLTQFFAQTISAKYLSFSEVECPVCGWTGKSFRPYLVMPLWIRTNAACPSCLSLERHRGLFIFYKKRLQNLAEHGLTMHYAAEDCLKPIFQKIPSIDYRPIYFTLEPMPAATFAAGGQVNQEHFGYRHGKKVPIIGDLQSIESDDETVSCLISHHVLEHVLDDKLALSEIYRVLTSNGVCFINVPMLPIGSATKQYKKVDSAGHWREYGDDFKDLCEGADFDVVTHFLGSDSMLSKKYGLDKNDRLYELTKQLAEGNTV